MKLRLETLEGQRAAERPEGSGEEDEDELGLWNRCHVMPQSGYFSGLTHFKASDSVATHGVTSPQISHYNMPLKVTQHTEGG